jgi:DNA polymerase-3 subunit gamma/tau
MAKVKEPAPKAKPATPPPPPPAPPSYTVVARRYRPQQFSDLIGQEHVATALTNAITSGRIAHAYLFTGARGTGKTSTARILAKALNCEQGPTATPCDKCAICIGIMNGSDVDVVEIDGASNRKIEDARELRSNISFRPTRGRFKIYIIDEVHMLTNESFNALLKTMEEPPPHVKFILATTEVQKIPITILSRCQRYDFATVGPAKMLATLTHIATKEGIDADEDALRIIARRANGSMRDSQTLLEQLLGAADGKLTADKVHALLGSSSDERVLELAGAILGGDAKRAVEVVGASAEQGLQLGELLDQLVDYWRGLMLVAVGGGDPDSLGVSAAVQEQMTAHAAGTNLDAILAGIDILAATKTKMRGSPHTQVLVEVAAIRLARLADLLSVAQIAQWVSDGKAGTLPAPVGKIPAHGPPPAAVGSTTEVKKKVVSPPEVTAKATGETEGPSEANFEVLWERVLVQVGPMLAAQLRQSTKLQANFKPNALVIEYDAGYSSTCEMVRTERNLDTLRKALRVVSGDEWLVRVELNPLRASAANGVSHSTVAEPPRPPASSPRGRNALLTLPMFQAATEVLGAQLMRADDGFDPTGEAAAPTTATPATDDTTPAPPDPDEA